MMDSLCLTCLSSCSKTEGANIAGTLVKFLCEVLHFKQRFLQNSTKFLCRKCFKILIEFKYFYTQLRDVEMYFENKFNSSANEVAVPQEDPIMVIVEEKDNQVGGSIGSQHEKKHQPEKLESNIIFEDEESSDEPADEDLFIAAIASSQSERKHTKDAIASSQHGRKRTIKFNNYVDSVVAAYDELSFQENFRLTREAYDSILREVTLNWKEETSGRKQTSINTQLLTVIWLLATPDSYRSISQRFELSKGNVSRCFVRIVNALNEAAPKFIQWPSGAELAATKAKFASKSQFKDLVGIIDGTYVPMKAPKNQSSSYTNQKGFESMTLQCVCDSEMKFIHSYVGWPSSVSDIRVFKNSDIFIKCQENEKEYFPNGEYILGDRAYPCLSWCIPPYMQDTPLTNPQNVFNEKHASTRAVIENSFALLFGRFRRLRHLDMNRTDWIPSAILACCVLHNICLDFNDSKLEEYISEGRETVRRIDCNQDTDDYEIGVVEGITKRNQLCNQMNT